MATWLEDVIKGLEELNGLASLQDIYSKLRTIRPLPHGEHFKSSIRSTIKKYSPDSKVFIGGKDNEIFYSIEGIGGGVWGLHSKLKLEPGSEVKKGPMGPEPVPPSPGGDAAGGYSRSPSVALRALEKANFKCEIAPAHNTFVSSAKDRPYVEAHHLVPVCRQSDYPWSFDVDENVVALCPHRHKLLRHGRPTEKNSFLKQLFLERKRGLNEKGILLNEQTLLDYYSGDLLEES